MNGCPGPWWSCIRGLRQGDPLSPYLFLLVADVLQTLIKRDGRVKHPLAPAESCAVLQYADDTMIVMEGNPTHVCTETAPGQLQQGNWVMYKFSEKCAGSNSHE
jgi:hypothetical protein